MKAMKKANPKAVWVAQAWQANPRPKMIENLKAGDLLILDLTSECRPQWEILLPSGIARTDTGSTIGSIVCF